MGSKENLERISAQKDDPTDLWYISYLLFLDVATGTHPIFFLIRTPAKVWNNQDNHILVIPRVCQHFVKTGAHNINGLLVKNISPPSSIPDFFITGNHNQDNNAKTLLKCKSNCKEITNFDWLCLLKCGSPMLTSHAMNITVTCFYINFRKVGCWLFSLYVKK